MKIYAGRLLTRDGWIRDQVVSVENGRISRVESGTSGDLCAEVLTYGLMDPHNHGGCGFDVSRPEWEDLPRWLNTLLDCGVLGVLMTLGTGPEEGMRESLTFIREVMRLQTAGELGGASVLGAHLEGPFISAARPGAMNTALIQPPSVAFYDRVFGEFSDAVRLVTLAPEVPGAEELAASLMRRGICVQAGHTDAEYEDGVRAFGQGIDSVCHFFNAARGIHHRKPGILTAALVTRGVYAETICDFVHLHPGAIRLIYQNKGPDYMMLISDSVISTGLPDGRYTSVNHDVIVKDGVTRTPSCALSGGGCNLDQSVRNLISIGISSEDAFHMASRTAYRRLRIPDMGEIVPGARVLLSAFDGQYQPDFQMIDQNVYGRKR